MSTIRRVLKEAAISAHKLGTKMGVHVLPVSYYSPVPNILKLKRTKETWAKPSQMPGINVDLDGQLELLSEVCRPYQLEYAGNKTYQEAQDKHFGLGYGPIEAQALHGIVRHFKPRHIVEVGAGVSTYCMHRALELNSIRDGRPGRITSVEPYPSPALKTLPNVELLSHPVQHTEMSTFTSLGEDSLLFIDSSHTVRPGGDVNFLILEVLPRLQPGVIVHIHDIYLPYDYQRDVCDTFFHWAETSLVRAFLTHNPRVEMLVCMSLLHYERSVGLRQIFPEYEPQANDMGMQPERYRPINPAPGHFPSSLYLRMK